MIAPGMIASRRRSKTATRGGRRGTRTRRTRPAPWSTASTGSSSSSTTGPRGGRRVAHQIPSDSLQPRTGGRHRAEQPRRLKAGHLSSPPRDDGLRDNGLGRAGGPSCTGGGPSTREACSRTCCSRPSSTSGRRSVWKSKFYGAFVLNRRDACSMAWRCRFHAARPSQDGRAIAEK